MKYNKNRQFQYLLLLLGLMLLSACASTVPKVSKVEERATERWNTLLSGDLAGAYEYLSPGYRSSVSSMQYQRSILLQRVRWKSAKYVGEECKEATCKVKIALGYAIHGVLPGVKSFEGTQKIEESWVLVEGIWYMVPK